ncbi:NADPH-dependent F420 reductase [Pseudomonas kitaguniensis]|uniref:NADPH-dependent F420 reductase n=1 Tax=Pseudomonas kitaguniensis TaxID=2607908 RepID=UPI003CFFDC09
MKISVIGTGMVGRVLAARLAAAGHNVVIGTRDPARTLSRVQSEDQRTPPFAEWRRNHTDIPLLILEEAGAHGEVLVNATMGDASLAAFIAIGEQHTEDKVILDLALPLDRSPGKPPRLLYALTDSLGERMQHAMPRAQVVKTLTSVTAGIMVDPGRLPGRHNIFTAGDNQCAKETARHVLASLGWPEQDVIDLGGIEAARALEMYTPLLFALAGRLGTWDFNISVVKA